SRRASRRSARVRRAASRASGWIGSPRLALACVTVTLCHLVGDRLSPGARAPRGEAVTYAGSLPILDADSHVMELSDFLDDHIDPAQRDRLRRRAMEAFAPLLEGALAGVAARRSDPAVAGRAEER